MSVLLSLPESTRKQLRRASREGGLTVSAALREAIALWLDTPWE